MAKKNRYRWGRLDFSKPFPKVYKIMLILGILCTIFLKNVLMIMIIGVI